MEIKKINIDELIQFMNMHEGEFFVHAILNEKGEAFGEFGESDGCSDNKTGKRKEYHV